MIAASVNFPVWRGRVRHSFKYPMLGRFARRTGFMDAAYGPSQFYFGELFASERTGAPASIGVGGKNDAYAAAVGRWLVARDGFDFLLFYLPETDSAGHRGGDAAAARSRRGRRRRDRDADVGGRWGRAVPRALRGRAVRRPRTVADRLRRRRTRRVSGPAPVPRARTHRSRGLRSRGRGLEPSGTRLPPRERDAARRDRRTPARALLGRRRSLARGRACRRPARGDASCASSPAVACATGAGDAGSSRASSRRSGSRATRPSSRRPTRTRSSASGRSSRASTPATSSCRRRRATSSATPAAQATSGAARTGRCTRSTRWCRSRPWGSTAHRNCRSSARSRTSPRSAPEQLGIGDS